MRRLLLVAVLAVAALAGGHAAAPAATVRTSHVDARTQNDLRFTRSTIHLRAGRVTVAMRNPATNQIVHAIAITGHGVTRSGAPAAPGRTSRVTVRLKPGTYTFFCPINGHRAAGMQGTIVVR
jgi:plastocyanin